MTASSPRPEVETVLRLPQEDLIREAEEELEQEEEEEEERRRTEEEARMTHSEEDLSDVELDLIGDFMVKVTSCQTLHSNHVS